MLNAKLTASTLAIIAVSATAASARDQVQVAGSSTVLPYASIVAEAFGENFDFPTPVVESGGSSAGLKRFCEGVGENTIDIANASRKIRENEIAVCAAADVTDIIEVRIGYDGIVFASQIDGPAFDAFSTINGTWPWPSRSWWTAHWSTIRIPTGPRSTPSLPNVDIQAFIPGTKHGTREVFEEKVLLVGCEHSGAMEAMIGLGKDEDAAEDACMSVRTDGRSVDIDGDYTETLGAD